MLICRLFYCIHSCKTAVFLCCCMYKFNRIINKHSKSRKSHTFTTPGCDLHMFLRILKDKDTILTQRVVIWIPVHTASYPRRTLQQPYDTVHIVQLVKIQHPFASSTFWLSEDDICWIKRNFKHVFKVWIFPYHIKIYQNTTILCPKIH